MTVETPPAEPNSSTARPSDRRVARGRLFRREWLTASATPIGFLVILVVVFGIWLGGRFLSPQDRVFDIYQSVPPLLISIGVVIALSCGQFDLSAGTMATLSCFLTVGLVAKQHWPMWTVLMFVLAIGVAGGLLNGLLVVGMRINAFIATLGTGGVFTGISVLYSNGQTISYSTDPNAVKEVAWFTGPNSMGSFQEKVPVVLAWALMLAVLLCMLSAVRLLLAGVRRPRARDIVCVVAVAVLAVLLGLAGVPRQINWTIFLLGIAALAVWMMLRQTRFGRNTYATGGNPVAARLAGIHTSRLVVFAFVASGVFAAASGIILAADQGTAVPNIADSFLLPAYAAAFLSTVIFSSGRFHVWGTVAGGLAVVYIAQGLVIGGVPFTWTDLINGAVLIVAVALSTTLRRAITTR